MGRTLSRQDINVWNSSTYNGGLAAGSALESGAGHLEDDLNGLRSQVKRILDDAAGNWYDDIPTVNSKKRDLRDLNTDLDDIENHKVLCRALVLTNITVPNAQNWHILDVSSSQAPTQVIASATTVKGAVCAKSALNGAGFNVHELIEIAGANAISPKNLGRVLLASNMQPLQSSGRDVYALLQVESTSSDGAAFNDTSGGNRGKISFVRMNAAYNDLEACPVADIENKVVRYHYVFRSDYDSVAEDCFLALDAFVDQVASVDVTLDNAIDNQIGTATQGQNIVIQISPGFHWKYKDNAGQDIFSVQEGSSGGTTSVHLFSDVDTFDSDAVVNDFAQGVTIASSKTRPIQVGVNDGVIETAGSGDDLEIRAASEVFLDDGNQPGSWAQTQGVKLSDTSTEWSDYETIFGGEVSLLRAIYLARTAGSRGTKVYASVLSNSAADTNMTGAGGSPNLSAQLPNMSGGNFLTDYDVFVNGSLMQPGANAGANNDYYPGTSLANGDLRFEFNLKGGGNPDVLCVVPYA